MKIKMISMVLFLTSFVQASVPAGIIRPGGVFATGWAQNVKIDSQGRIVACGLTSSGWTVARFKKNGALDTTFNSSGTPGYRALGNGRAFALTLQSDGQILVVGYRPGSLSSSKAILIRYTPNGDSAIQIDLFTDTVASLSNAVAVGIDNTGTKIVCLVCNRLTSTAQMSITCNIRDITDLSQVSVATLPTTLSGSTDPTQFKGGLDFKPTSNQLVVCTSNWSSNTNIAQRLNFPYTSSDIVLPVLTIPGVLENSVIALEDAIYFKAYGSSQQLLYITDGALANGASYPLTARDSVQFSPTRIDGGIGFSTGVSKIVMVASSTANDIPQPCIGRFITATGALDTTFGVNGITIQTGDAVTPGYFTNFAFQDHEKAVAVGGNLSAGGWVLARYDSNGVLDKSFGANLTGVLLDSEAPFDTMQDGLIYTTTIDQSGDIVVGGQYGTDAVSVRYTYSAGRNGDYGANGVTQYNDFSPSHNYYVRQDAEGSYYFSGDSTVDATAVLTVFKYNSEGILDASFGADGVVQATSFGQSRAFGLAQNAIDESLMVVGQITVNSQLVPAFILYDASGNLVTEFGRDGVQTFSGYGTGSLYATVVHPTLYATGAGGIANKGTSNTIASLVQIRQGGGNIDQLETGL